MQITQILNNNAVSAVNDKGEELVLMGRGIGFHSKVGCAIDAARAEKVFALSAKNKDKFKALIEDIPFEYVQISDEIISIAKAMLGKHLSENIYITLIDHISFAMERHKQGIALSNAMLLEIRSFYREEFKVGEKAVSLIAERFGAALGEDEAGFIALHLVNAGLDTGVNEFPKINLLIRDVLAIVSTHFAIIFDEDSLSYHRFATHLRYLARRVLKKSDASYGFGLNELLREDPKAYECAKKIEHYIQKQHDFTISDEDLIFLTVHLRRLIVEHERK